MADVRSVNPGTTVLYTHSDDCICRQCRPLAYQRRPIPVLADVELVSHPLTRIDAIAEAINPTPVTCTLTATDAFVGTRQLRTIVASFRMPSESRELLLRIAAALEASK